MLNHNAANFTNSERKLEEIERELKNKLERAREITAAAIFDDLSDKTQEELVHDLEVLYPLCRNWTYLSLTLLSITLTNIGRSTFKIKLTAPSSGKPIKKKLRSKSSYHRYRYWFVELEPTGWALSHKPPQKPQEKP